jgi:ribosome-associated protein
MDEQAPVTPGGIRLDPACLSWRFARSGGPGGQHVNTSSSKAELRCDLGAAGLPASLLERLVAKLDTSEIRVVCSTERSQLRNRRLAMERLAEKLDDAAEIPLERRATRPSRGQRQARLNDKRARSTRKTQRRWRPGED